MPHYDSPDLRPLSVLLSDLGKQIEAYRISRNLKQAELAEAMAAAEKTGILSFGERSGMQKTEDLDDVCDELDELLECALDRMGGNRAFA